MFGVIAAWAFIQYATYSHAHAAITQYPNEGRHPAYQYDLFGDGTVIYQNTEISITYKIGRWEAMYALWHLDSPQFNRKPLPLFDCSVATYSFGKISENGCFDKTGFTYDKIASPLHPLLKALKLDQDQPDHAPNLPSGITAETYDFTMAKHKVDPPFWRPGPPPPDPNSVSSH
jgi:hypothetical protein